VYIFQKVLFINPHKQGNTSHHFFNKTNQYTNVTGWENRGRKKGVWKRDALGMKNEVSRKE
jgi:hypothetical protein